MSKAPSHPARCASELMEVIPLIMRTIRRRMREEQEPELSMSQFRILFYLGRCSGKRSRTLSDTAQFLGVRLPTASKMVESLVNRGLVSRRNSKADRRQIELALSAKGDGEMKKLRQVAEGRLQEILSRLGEKEQNQVIESMLILKQVFGHQEENS
jgi:DNA-binding MarR family transcriptional regulator